MTQDEIIFMAKQSGLVKRHDCQEWVCNTNDLEAFAKLVEQHEREACAQVCEKGQVSNSCCLNSTFNAADAIRARGKK